MNRSVSLLTRDGLKLSSIHRQAGALVLEYILTVLILLIISSGLIVSQVSNFKNHQALITANEISTLVSSAANYMQNETQNFSTNSVLSSSVPIAIPFGNTATATITTGPGGVPTVQAAGFLPPSFIDEDPFGQTHFLVVRKLANGSYQGMVISSGGTTISNGLIGLIINYSSGVGALITNATYNGSNQFVFQGAANQWHELVSDFVPASGLPSISTGHYAATLNYNTSANGLSSYLNRYAVTGVPEANTMHADINMGNNSIASASGITLNQGGQIVDNGSSSVLILGNTINSGTTTVSSDIVAGNANTTGTETINGSSTVAGTETASTGAVINSETLSAIGTAGDACPTIGAMASSTDGKGVILACEGTAGNSVWVALDGGSSSLFKNYQSLGCSNTTSGYLSPNRFQELAWNNTLSTPVAVYENYQPFTDGQPAYVFVYDSAGNQVILNASFGGNISNASSGNLPTIVPPYGSIMIYNPNSVVCLYIRY